MEINIKKPFAIIKGGVPHHIIIDEIRLFTGESIVIPATDTYPEGRIYFDGKTVHYEGSAAAIPLSGCKKAKSQEAPCETT